MKHSKHEVQIRVVHSVISQSWIQALWLTFCVMRMTWKKTTRSLVRNSRHLIWDLTVWDLFAQDCFHRFVPITLNVSYPVVFSKKKMLSFKYLYAITYCLFFQVRMLNLWIGPKSGCVCCWFHWNALYPWQMMKWRCTALTTPNTLLSSVSLKKYLMFGSM